MDVAKKVCSSGMMANSKIETGLKVSVIRELLFHVGSTQVLSNNYKSEKGLSKYPQ